MTCFSQDIKWYLQNVTKGGIVDGGALSNAIDVNLESFVKFIKVFR